MLRERVQQIKAEKLELKHQRQNQKDIIQASQDQLLLGGEGGSNDGGQAVDGLTASAEDEIAQQQRKVEDLEVELEKMKLKKVHLLLFAPSSHFSNPPILTAVFCGWWCLFSLSFPGRSALYCPVHIPPACRRAYLPLLWLQG